MTFGDTITIATFRVTRKLKALAPAGNSVPGTVSRQHAWHWARNVVTRRHQCIQCQVKQDLAEVIVSPRAINREYGSELAHLLV